MNRQEKKTLPAQGARIFAALASFLLAGCLLGMSLSLIGLQGIFSEQLHTRVALSKDAVDRQMDRIAEQIEQMAKEYGFQAETVTAALTRESVESFDRQVVAWWTGALRTGEMGEEPEFLAEGISRALNEDTAFLESQDPTMVNRTVEVITGQVENTVKQSAVLFRDVLVQAGFRMAGERVNLPQMTGLLTRVPGILGLCALGLAGLIALLMSRRILTGGWYIGGGIAACGLLVLLVLALIKSANIQGMIGEASAALAAQWAYLARILTMEMLGTALACFLAGGGLMALAGKEWKKHG